MMVHPTKHKRLLHEKRKIVSFFYFIDVINLIQYIYKFLLNFPFVQFLKHISPLLLLFVVIFHAFSSNWLSFNDVKMAILFNCFGVAMSQQLNLLFTGNVQNVYLIFTLMLSNHSSVTS